MSWAGKPGDRYGAHWIMNAIISGALPLVAAQSKGAPFAFFAAVMGVQFFVVLLAYPETKRLSLEAMQARLAEPQV